MKERPIIFSAPMVKAILEGRKSMTRRIVKPQPEYRESKSLLGHYATWANGWNIDDPIGLKAFVDGCPYGGPGDRLWVKETFMGTKDCLSYRATDPRQVIEFGFDRWTPSIYMPRWASRITLEIVSVRVERVKEISEEDADKEGFGGDFPHRIFPELFNPDCGHLSMQECFAALWESIHGPGSWERNDWVWVIEFRRVR